MWLGILVSVALLRPDEALITSSICSGSRPALTPKVIASSATDKLPKEMMLLTSFIVCAAPGWSLR